MCAGLDEVGDLRLGRKIVKNRLNVMMLRSCHYNIYVALILKSGLYSVPVKLFRDTGLALENRDCVPGMSGQMVALP